MGIQAPAGAAYRPNFIRAMEEVARDPRRRETFASFGRPWFFLETAGEDASLFERAGFYSALMTTRIITRPMSRAELEAIAAERFGDLVKAVVDVEQGIMAIGGELHADEEAILLEQGSRQEDLWGINLYPRKAPDEWVEFDALINVRPSRGNRSRSVQDPEVRAKIVKILGKMLPG